MRVVPIVTLALAMLMGRAPAAAAEEAAAEPLRIAIDCQGWGRTKACPSFLLGFVESNPLFLSSPRSSAQVVLYYNVTEVANDDRVQLRFVGELAGAPPVVETMVDLDTRGDDDAQRAQLEPAFVRGAALYIAALHPGAVQISLVPVAAAAVVAPKTSPWGLDVSLGTHGSKNGRFTSFSGYANAGISRIDRTSAYSVSAYASRSGSRQPPLVIDGEEISLDSDQYSVSADVFAARHLDDHWALGAMSSIWHQDPEGQFEVGWQARGGVEWNQFPADDPRGNRLAVSYLAGWQIDKYNVRNVLKERFASYPIHALSAGGTVRKDKIGYGLSLSVSGELVHPDRRYTLSASPFVELQVGDHVDLSLSLSVTKRALPGPADLDEGNFEEVTRASYAEPLSAYASFNIRFHWDRTNGQRNDRFQGG